MELILQDLDGADLMYLAPSSLDYACGYESGAVTDPENEFEIAFSRPLRFIRAGMAVYCPGTGYGGILREQGPSGDGVKWVGDTWEGVLSHRVIVPDGGVGALTASGEANGIIRSLVKRLDLGDVFTVAEWGSGIEVKAHTFDYYEDALSGLHSMLSERGARLRVLHDGDKPQLAAVAAKDWGADESFDTDLVDVQVTVDHVPINHLVGRGEGQDGERVAVDLFLDDKGNVSETQTLKGRFERAEYYNYTNADRDKLIEDGTKKLKGYWKASRTVKVEVNADVDLFALGDSVGGVDHANGLTASAEICKKVLKLDEDGTMTVSYTAG